MQNPYIDVFKKHQPWRGHVPAGYTASFVGSLSRIDRLYPGPYLVNLKNKAAKGYFEETCLPLPNHPNYFEMGAVLEAVNRASGTFNMIELGAGTGPWTAAAACATAGKGIKSRFFVAVEGEPTRSEWLRENLEKNSIAASESDIRRAVVFPSNKKEMKIYFPVGAPLFAGHGARTFQTEPDASKLQRRIEYVDRVEDAVLEAAPVVSLTELLSEEKDRIFDIAHIDIQGVEDEVIEDAAEAIQAKLRSVAIGTHSVKVEKNLEQTFTKLGWECVFSFGTNSEFEVDGTVISTKGLDGFQHWINPKLL